MPVLDANALDIDPEGMSLLRSVLDTGRRAKRRKVEDLLVRYAPRPAEAVGIMSVEIERDLDAIPPAVLATLAD